MNKNKKIELSKEEWDKGIKAIQLYFEQEREEDLGTLSATLILQFILEKIGPSIYNQGLHDAIGYLNEKVEDIYGLEK